MDNAGVSSKSLLIFEVTNCFSFIVGTNKSQYVINSMVETVRIERLYNFVNEYPNVGHTKNEADELFAKIGCALVNADYFNI